MQGCRAIPAGPIEPTFLGTYDLNTENTKKCRKAGYLESVGLK